jgi:hypothetical protein
MAWRAWPSLTAAKASSKLAHAIGSSAGKASRAAMCELAPGSP